MAVQGESQKGLSDDIRRLPGGAKQRHIAAFSDIAAMGYVRNASRKVGWVTKQCANAIAANLAHGIACQV